MNLSLNWLKKYINISSVSIEEMAHKLTMAGLEVEAIHKGAVIPETIIVGEILTRDKHPNADKLSVCTVNIGTESPLQIVCGAHNCDAGKRVPVAVLGTVFPSEKGDFVISEVKLRGVQSCGMMCSARELGISNDHDGLLHLPSETPIWKKVCELFNADTTFELEITPNRPDWLSHWGVARDLSILIDTEPQFPEIKVDYPSQVAPSNLVTVEDHQLCPYYSARIIRGVKVKESPTWLKETIQSIGLRPINNIVDITNFVLHELGSPLHAFDLNKLSEKRIIVRHAKENEPFTTLDGKLLKLQPKHLVIADAEKAVVLAGVMGGLNSGVTTETTDILLESAEFFSSQIRSTSREFMITSDSSYRYERGIDPKMTSVAADRATQLILDIAGGVVEFSPFIVGSNNRKMNSFEISFDRINALLGTKLSTKYMVDILEKLGATCSEQKNNIFSITPPTYRADLTREADIAEEIARIYGLDNIPFVQPRAIQGGLKKDDKMFSWQKLRDQVAELGFYECYSYSMVDEKVAKHDPSIAEDDIICISNPLNLDMAYMRPSLWIQMIQNIGRNVARNTHDLKLFELGRCFCANRKHNPEERLELMIAMTGSRFPNALSSETSALDFYDLKGVLASLCELRNVSYSVKPIIDARFVQGTAAEVIIAGKSIGIMGEVAHSFTKSLRLRNKLFALILQATKLLKGASIIPQLEQLPIYPSVTRDIAFVADESLENQTVIDFIAKLKLNNFEDVKLFDIFRDEKVLGVNKKSMAYSLTFLNRERTLKDEEVNIAYHTAREQLALRLNVELR